MPRPRNPVVRRRLCRVLDRALGSRGIWVTGPAGAGKTTLVASHIADKSGPCLWYQADAGDADVGGLFYYLGLAVSAKVGRRRVRLPLLTPEYIGGLPAFSRRYFEVVFQTLGDHAVVVFDNYQDVATNAAWHEALVGALAAVPETCSIVFISRCDPPPHFAASLAQGALTVIGGATLGFSVSEAAALVRRRSPRQRPSRSGLTHLVESAHGWAAGLVLLLEGGGAQEGRAVAAVSGTQAVFDYFATEVFGRLEPVTRKLLLRTALLPTLTGDMAASLTGVADAPSILARLHRDGFFTNRDSSGAYRYHPLFRAFLLDRAASTMERSALTRLRRRAGVLLAKNGLTDEAVELLGEAGDEGGIVQLVLAHAPALVAQGRGSTLEAWIERLPAPMVEANEWLLYWKGAALLAQGTPSRQALFERALSGFRRSGDRAGMFLALAGLVHSIAFRAEDFSKLDPWIRELDAADRSGLGYPAPVIEVQATIAVVSALTWWRPEGIDAQQWLARALTLAEGCKDAATKLTIFCLELPFHVFDGDLAKANIALGRVYETLAGHPGAAPILTCARTAEALCHLISGDVAAAREACAAGIHLSRHHGVTVYETQLLASQAALSLHLGEPEQARAPLERAELLAARGTNYHRGTYHYHLGWLFLLRGDLRRALIESERCLAHAEELHLILAVGFSRVAHAVALFEVGRKAESQRQLAMALALSQRHQTWPVRYGALLVAADHQEREGNLAEAQEALREAFSLGCRQGIMTTPWVTPEVLARLCARALEEGIEVEHVRGQIRCFQLPAPASCPRLWPWTLKIHTLSGFELIRGDLPGEPRVRLATTPCRLMQALVADGGEATQESLCDRLWPDSDGDAARRSLDTTLHRLRKAFGETPVVRLGQGRLSLDRTRVWIDTWEAESLAERIQAAVGVSAAQNHEENVQRLGDRLSALFHGPLVEGSDGTASKPTPRWARLLRDVARAFEGLTAHALNAGDEARAAAFDERRKHILATVAGASPRAAPDDVGDHVTYAAPSPASS